ncbi:hypothetical protein [Halomarina rubra]|uniref:Uncharacterized protein n=1 Tax=Halomarina rubra TaxID=2071873 RepID=A0ABD6ATZ7_9EURY|nr:hypothetical protein [Halomarina rubra]
MVTTKRDVEAAAPPDGTAWVVTLRETWVRMDREEAEARDWYHSATTGNGVLAKQPAGTVLSLAEGTRRWRHSADRLAAVGEAPLFERLDSPGTAERQAFRVEAEQAVSAAKNELSALHEAGELPDPEDVDGPLDVTGGAT